MSSAFPWGGLTVLKMCHSLSDESVVQLQYLGSWCQFPDAHPWDEIDEWPFETNQHPKAKESIAITSDMIQV